MATTREAKAKTKIKPAAEPAQMAVASPSASPRWGSTTKLVVALTVVVIVGAMTIRFSNIIGPLLISFTLSYLLHPLASALGGWTKLSWRASVSLVYLLILILLGSALTLGGVGLVNQIQSFISVLQSSLEELPTILPDAIAWVSARGIDLSNFNLTSISDQLLSVGKTVLSQTGTVLGSVAGSAATFLGWSLFVLLISFFVLLESGGLREDIFKVDIPGYTADINRLSIELSRIWKAFLRGQIIIFAATITVYFVVLSLLGVQYAIGLAIAAGFARFVPYIGPAINWTILVLVTYFQPDRPFFAEQPLNYTLVIFITALVIDQVFDNIVSPRILADALRVHPAAVLVAALISASLLGILGVVIAAPMLATLQLFGQYMLRKMFDLNPWPEMAHHTAPSGPSLRARLNALRTRK